jgi:hypothetical protein
MQVFVFAQPTIPRVNASAAPSTPQVGATFKTTNNLPVLVNGINVKPGTTILSGAAIETTPGAGATVHLDLADVEIAPGSEIVFDFTPEGSSKVMLKRGCVILRTRENAQGTIITPDGTSTPTGDRKVADVCYREGAASPVVNQGAPAQTGTAGGGAAGANTGGISRALFALLLVGATGTIFAAAIIANRGDNPSPSNP